MNFIAKQSTVATPRSDIEQEITFLQRVHPTGPWVLTCIAPDKRGIQTVTLHPGQEDDLRGWLEQYNDVRNLYWSVNPVREDMTTKATKQDIARVEWFHVDIDPAQGRDIAEEKARAIKMLEEGREGIPPPTLILDSGGGIQAFWKLDEPIELDGSISQAEQAEEYNRAIQSAYGGDHCSNIDRIMRLAGSLNLPDAKKAAKGRVPALAHVVSYDPSRVYLPANFPRTAGGRHVKYSERGTNAICIDTSQACPVDDVNFLDQWNVPVRVKEIVAQGDARSSEGPKPKDDSRSAWLFDALCCMARCGVPHHVMYAVITDAKFGISASILDKGRNAHAYALRQIERASEYEIAPQLCELNERFAVIENIGGKCRVLEIPSPDDGLRQPPTLQTFEDFDRRYQNQMIEGGRNANGDPRLVSLGKWWLRHARRRQYERMAFAPGTDDPRTFNLWQGFAFAPVEGEEHLPFLDFVRSTICADDIALYDYVIGWMATCVQSPGAPGHTALVLRGDKGVGKTFFVSHFGRLFGRHYVKVSSNKHLTGNFNSHLEEAILLFADEAFAVNDPQGEAILKTLITEDLIAIERKGLDVRMSPNCAHLILASNNDWVVPASVDERRYAVLDVNSRRQGDSQYFGELAAKLENGGYANLLQYLMSLPLGGFNVRKAPKTAALDEQRAATLGGFDRALYRMLQAGRLPVQRVEAPETFVSTALLEAYAKTFLPPGTEVSAVEVGDLLGEGRIRNGRISKPGLRCRKERRDGVRGWLFPSLEEARRRWDARRFPGHWSMDAEPWEPINPDQLAQLRRPF